MRLHAPSREQVQERGVQGEAPLFGGTIGLALEGCQSSVMEERGATPGCPANLRCL